MDTHMHQTALMISKLLTAAELSLETAAAPHTQQVVDAQTKLRKAIGEWDLCKQAAGEAAADAEILRSTKSKMTARPGSIAAQSMAEALAGANSLKQSSTQALAAAQLAMKIAEAEVKEAQAPYQAELDLVDGLRSLQRTFDTERTSMEKAVAASAVSQYQNECAQATRDYVKPNAEMTWEERRDSDRTR